MPQRPRRERRTVGADERSISRCLLFEVCECDSMKDRIREQKGKLTFIPHRIGEPRWTLYRRIIPPGSFFGVIFHHTTVANFSKESCAAKLRPRFQTGLQSAS